jgi:hypothetical protein
VLYLNFDGGPVQSGNCSDARTNCSNIVMGNNVHLPAFSRSAEDKQRVIDLVRAYYEPFNIQVVTQRPTGGEYAMVMVGGVATDVGLDDNRIGGIAPLDCGNMNANDITFAFSAASFYNNDMVALAATLAQESAHAYGLGHTNDTADIMYPYVNDDTEGFVNRTMRIYDATGGNSDCSGTGLQNSYQMMIQNVGSNVPDVTPPTVAFVDLQDGAQLASGFAVTLDAHDDRSVAAVELWANDQMVASLKKYPYHFTVQAGSVPAGSAHLRGVARDRAGNQGESAEVGVTIKPIGETPGDLGTACNVSADCNGGGFCASSESKPFCTRNCSASGAMQCPANFDCKTTEQFSSICEPQVKDSGCAALPAGSRQAGTTAALLLFGALAALVRRRGQNRAR